MRTLALTLAALMLIPVAGAAKQPQQQRPPTRATAASAAPPAVPAEADLSALRTTEYGSAARRPTWQADRTHTYDARGVDCTLYPARCRN